MSQPLPNTCRGWECRAPIPAGRAFCEACWRDVPQHMRQAVLGEIKRHQHQIKSGKLPKNSPLEYGGEKVMEIAAVRAMEARCERDPKAAARRDEQVKELVARMRAEAAGLTVPGTAPAQPGQQQPQEHRTPAGLIIP